VSSTKKTSVPGVYARGAKFVYVINRTDPLTGMRRQVWSSGYATVRAAKEARTAALADMSRGAWVAPSRQTIGELLDEWLEARRPTLRESTHESYSRYLRLHVRPTLGHVPVTAVDAGTLNALYARLLASGNLTQHAGGQGLSPRTVRYVHTILGAAFKDAVRWGRLVRSPADAANPPKASAAAPPEPTVWTPEQTALLLSTMAADRRLPAWLTAATTGARRGELLGLRWRDVDLNKGSAAIRQTVVCVAHRVTFSTPKTRQGTRSIKLDDRTVAVLREHKRRQAADRLAVGPAWIDHDLLFAGPTGEPLHPERFTRSFQTVVAKVGLPRIRLHDLRHGWASTALSAGVHPRVVQERLGHANIGITLGTYSHVTPSLHSDAAEAVAALYGALPEGLG
jgi:integrase